MNKRNIVVSGLIVALVAVFSLSLIINRAKLKTHADVTQDTGLVLTGRALKSDGSPVQGFASLSNGNTMILGSDGSFSFSGLVPQTYVVEIFGFDGTQYRNGDLEFGQFYVGADPDAINDLVLANLKTIGKLEGFDGPATDTNPPIITHTPITNLPAGKDATIPFSVIDQEWGKRFGAVNLYYAINNGDLKQANLNQDSTNQDQFTATIPGSDMQLGSKISYYIEASDPVGHISYFPDKSGADPESNAINLTVLAPPPPPTISPDCKVPDPLKTALVACYPLNEGSGTKVTDASGNGNDGTLSAAVKWDSAGCKVKACLIFTGPDYKVTIPDNPSLNPDAITVAAWVRPNAKTDQKFVSKLDANDKFGYALTGTPCCVAFFTGGGSAAYQPDTWVHLLGTAQNGNDAFYVNGQSSSGGLRTINKVSGPLILGGFAGALDEVMIWNRALTADEISSLYRQY